MKKIKFASIYLLSLAIVFLALGAFTQLHLFYSNALIEGIDDKLPSYPEFFHLIFFLLGLGTIISIYIIEKREAKVLAIANTALEKEAAQRKQVEEEREKLINDLRKALAEVKTLSGLLPICSACKKIRDDKGYWNQIEVFIRDHSDAQFSHSICPGCAQELYPDLKIYDSDNE